jgi:prepilin-type N-terminal cleavage/methylation domain-containing protein
MFPRLRPRRAFTLLELCVVMFIAVVIMGMALPSLTGQAAQNRLQKTFDRLDALVVEAQRRSVLEGKPHVLVWNQRGIVRLYAAADAAREERRKVSPLATLTPAEGSESYTLDRGASLSPGKPSSAWTFWPTGNCEPMTVRFDGAAGQWEAVYNPLSARANMTRFVTR